ncbi:MAG: hypothetical protein NZL92_03340 [Gloeomargarita sp. SKYG116]|nr:hypothetical protein [Gloeomargarita sp. SKYG116]MDW8400716.1 hypothetical protein [Gloeomargarita sp. SKYGB_i_bin116]
MPASGRWQFLRQLFNPLSWRGLVVTVAVAGGGSYFMYRLHDYHWNELMFQVQTVDFNILSHTLPTKLSLDLLRGDLAELQRTLDSGYGYFGLVVTDADGRQIIAMSRSEERWTRNLQLDHHPYDLLLDPPPTQPQKFYTSYAAKAPTPYPVQPQGRVIGRVYYVRRVPRSFIEDLAIWSQNPFELRDERFPYTITTFSAVLLWFISVIVFNAYHLNQRYLQQEKERIEQERQQVAETLAENQEQLSLSRNETQELRNLLSINQDTIQELKNILATLGHRNAELENVLETLSRRNAELERLIAQKEFEDHTQREKISRILTRENNSVGERNTRILLALYEANIIPHYNPKDNHLTSGGDLSPLRRVAKHLGQNFDKLRRIYWVLKIACQSRDKKFSYTYQKNDHKNCIDNFLSMLKTKGHITELSPLAQARVVNGQLRDEPEVINFINGGWLEIYIYDFFTRNYRVGDGWLKNLKYTLLDGQQGEFDLIHSFQDQISRETKLIIVECKSGDYAEKMGKYQNICRVLGLPAKQFIMLAVEVEDDQLENLSQKYTMTFANLNHLKQAFELAISSDSHERRSA